MKFQKLSKTEYNQGSIKSTWYRKMAKFIFTNTCSYYLHHESCYWFIKFRNDFKSSRCDNSHSLQMESGAVRLQAVNELHVSCELNLKWGGAVLFTHTHTHTCLFLMCCCNHISTSCTFLSLPPPPSPLPSLSPCDCRLRGAALAQKCTVHFFFHPFPPLYFTASLSITFADDRPCCLEYASTAWKIPNLCFLLSTSSQKYRKV